MPSGDLQRVAQDLRTIKSEALQAQQQIANIRREIEGLVAALSRGGTPTGEGIRRGTETLLLGRGSTGRTDPRMRVGGGARFNLDVASRELQQAIDEYAQAQMDAAKARFDKVRVVGAGTRPADIETRFQQVLAGMEQAILARLGQLETIFLGGLSGGALPPGDLTALSRAGMYPALPPGAPSVRGGIPGVPLLPMGQLPLAPAGPGFVPEMDVSGGGIIEGQFKEISGSLDAIIIEEQKLLSAVTASTLAAEEEAANRERANEAWRRITQVESGAGGPDTETAEERRERILGRRQRRVAVRQRFRETYGQFGPERLQQVQAEAAKAGFTVDDIKKVETFAGSYTRVGYAVQDAEGIMRKMTVTVDKAGNTLVSTQKQFRTFFGAIRRNIGEMIKWSAAVLLVWGSIRKLQELVSLAIENETQLANVAVVLGEAHADLARIFDEAAEAAYATGESITGVIEGYAAAYRATGNIENQAERSRVAQQLLTDSLILSKLSTLDQAEALDTLVGALRQAGLDLDQGAELMDKWVRVSRYAQVSIETLAESFAITATSAQNAGVDVEYLNGLIATIAEVTTLSASESGNAIRAFISSFKSDSAVKELGQFGIAVTDLQGETRDFLSIMQEIAALFQAGVISEQQLNQIGRAIGGRGARREAQVVAVIKNLSRAQELAELQADSTGEAQAALAIQLETVQTSLTRLDNAFLTLARTMGSEGGVLDATGTVIELFTDLLNIVSSLTKNLGGLTPIMAGLGLAMAATTPQTRQYYYGTGALRAGEAVERISPRLGGGLFDFLTAPGIGRGARFAGGGVAQLATGGLALGSAYFSAREGDYASAGGAIAGAAIGALVTGGSPIGIAIGSAAGKAMANALFNYEGEFENFFKNTIGSGVEDALSDEDVYDPMQEALDTAFRAATPGGTSLAGGRAFAVAESWLQNQVTGFANLFRETPGEFMTPEEFARQRAAEMGRGPEVEAAIRRAQEYQQAQEGFEAEGFEFETVRRQQAYLEEYGEQLEALETAEADLARQRALTGEITERELRTSLEIIPKLQSGISAYAVGFGEAFANLNPQIEDANDTMEAFANILIQSAPEQLEYLSGINSEIARLTNLVQLAQDAGEDFIIFKPDDPATEESEEIRYNLAQSNEEIERLRENAALFATTLNQAAQASFIQLPSITTLDIRPEDLEKVLDRAREAQREYIRSTFAADLNEGVSIQEIEATFDPIMIQAGESGGFTYAEGFMTSFLTQVVPQMQAAGEILAPQPQALQIRQLDISSGQLPALMSRYNQLVESIRAQAAAGGFEVDLTEETFAGLLTDYVAVPITANLSLLNLGMNELIDVNKKQLQGVYNLPTDASFYVPFQGYELGLGDGGGLGGAAGDLTGSADELDDAARELKNAAIMQRRLARARAVGARYQGLDAETTYRQPALIGGEKYLEEYGTIGKQLALIGGEKYQEEYDIPVARFTGAGAGEALIGGEKYLEEYADQQGTFTDVFGQSVDTFRQGVDVFNSFIYDLFNIDRPTETPPIERDQITPAPIIPTPTIVPEAETEPAGFFERILQLFIDSNLFGFTGTGLGAGGFGPSPLDSAALRFENAVSTFETLVPLGPPQFGAPLATGGITDVATEFGSVVDLLSQKISGLSGFTTNLKISSTSTTQLIVDGRTLAEVVKPYLYSDMIRFEDSASSVTKNIVV